jgi:hypothetical protein
MGSGIGFVVFPGALIWVCGLPDFGRSMAATCGILKLEKARVEINSWNNLKVTAAACVTIFHARAVKA